MDAELVRDWLKALGVLTAGAMDAAEVNARLDAMIPHLIEEFSPDVFNRKSLHAVATNARYFPTYGELVPLLREWQRNVRDIPSVSYDPAGLNDEERLIVQNWEKHASGNWGKIIPLNTDRSLWFELDLYRRMRERVFNHLVANNQQAERIARRNGWIPPLRAAAAAIRPDTRYGPPDA
jgi:hypothetical protein